MLSHVVLSPIVLYFLGSAADRGVSVGKKVHVVTFVVPENVQQLKKAAPVEELDPPYDIQLVFLGQLRLPHE